MAPFSLFITGTDTGVGKTFVTAGLASALARRGCNVGVMKPVATGARLRKGKLVSSDAEILRRAAGTDDDPDLICPVRFRVPAAPTVAAEMSGTSVSLDRIVKAYRLLRSRHGILLVEGIGGLLVPIRPRCTVADLVRRLRLPLLIVARAALGTLNHTALTVSAARKHGLDIRGIVVNFGRSPRPDPVERRNPREIERLCGVPVFACLPRLGRSERVRRNRLFDRMADQIWEGR